MKIIEITKQVAMKPKFNYEIVFFSKAIKQTTAMKIVKRTAAYKSHGDEKLVLLSNAGNRQEIIAYFFDEA